MVLNGTIRDSGIHNGKYNSKNNNEIGINYGNIIIENKQHENIFIKCVSDTVLTGTSHHRRFMSSKELDIDILSTISNMVYHSNQFC